VRHGNGGGRTAAVRPVASCYRHAAAAHEPASRKALFTSYGPAVGGCPSDLCVVQLRRRQRNNGRSREVTAQERSFLSGKEGVQARAAVKAWQVLW